MAQSPLQGSLRHLLAIGSGPASFALVGSGSDSLSGAGPQAQVLSGSGLSLNHRSARHSTRAVTGLLRPLADRGESSRGKRYARYWPGAATLPAFGATSARLCCCQLQCPLVSGLVNLRSRSRFSLPISSQVAQKRPSPLLPRSDHLVAPRNRRSSRSPVFLRPPHYLGIARSCCRCLKLMSKLQVSTLVSRRQTRVSAPRLEHRISKTKRHWALSPASVNRHRGCVNRLQESYDFG